MFTLVIINGGYRTKLNKLFPLLAFSILLLVPVGSPQIFAQLSISNQGGPGTLISIPQNVENADQISNLFQAGVGLTNLNSFSGEQTFVPSVDNLSALEVMLLNLGNSGTSTDVTVEIYEGTPGSGILLGSSSTSVNPVPFGDGTIPVALTRFEFASPHIPLTPGQPHFIQITSSGIADAWMANCLDDYPNGELYVDNNIVPGCDFIFITYFLDHAVGGESLSVDSTALILAGAQTFSWIIPVVLSGIGIGLFIVSRKSENA